MAKLRAWWARLRDKGCESNWHSLNEFNPESNYGRCSGPCGLPSVATVWIFGNRFRACRWHVEPLDGVVDNTHRFSSLVFLSRWQRRAPEERV